MAKQEVRLFDYEKRQILSFKTDLEKALTDMTNAQSKLNQIGSSELIKIDTKKIKKRISEPQVILVKLISELNDLLK